MAKTASLKKTNRFSAGSVVSCESYISRAQPEKDSV